jgi:hypothetical protein
MKSTIKKRTIYLFLFFHVPGTSMFVPPSLFEFEFERESDTVFEAIDNSSVERNPNWIQTQELEIHRPISTVQSASSHLLGSFLHTEGAKAFCFRCGFVLSIAATTVILQKRLGMVCSTELEGLL